MRRPGRFLFGSVAVATGFVAGRLVPRGDGTDHPDDAELLGSVRGAPRMIRGPRASNLYTEWFGGETGTIVLTHGWCVTEAIWHHQKLALAAEGFRLVTWDLPGHGQSTPVPGSNLTLELGVDALARVVDEIDGEVVLVGHSLGGALSAGYLALHPETARKRVRGLVLVATPMHHLARTAAGRLPGSSLRARTLASAMQLAVENGVVDRWFTAEAGGSDARAASYRLIRIGFGARPRPSHVRFVRDVAATIPPAVRADTFRAMQRMDLAGWLSEVRVPALVVGGGRDRLVDPAELRAVARLLSKARLVQFPDAGHAVFLERHEEFNAELRRFAARRLRGGPSGRAILQGGAASNGANGASAANGRRRPVSRKAGTERPG